MFADQDKQGEGAAAGSDSVQPHPFTRSCHQRHRQARHPGLRLQEDLPRLRLCQECQGGGGDEQPGKFFDV